MHLSALQRRLVTTCNTHRGRTRPTTSEAFSGVSALFKQHPLPEHNEPHTLHTSTAARLMRAALAGRFGPERRARILACSPAPTGRDRRDFFKAQAPIGFNFCDFLPFCFSCIYACVHARSGRAAVLEFVSEPRDRNRTCRIRKATRSRAPERASRSCDSEARNGHKARVVI